MKYKILVMATVSVVCVTALKQSFGLTPIGCMGRICETGGTVVAQGTNCATSTRTCYDNQAVISCNTCNSGVTRTAKTVSVDLCEEPVTYYTCSSGGGSGSGIMCTPTYCAAGANITMRGQNCSSYASATCLDSPSGGPPRCGRKLCHMQKWIRKINHCGYSIGMFQYIIVYNMC